MNEESGFILASVKCPECKTDTFILFKEHELETGVKQHFSCCSCDFETTLTIMSVDDEAAE